MSKLNANKVGEITNEEEALEAVKNLLKRCRGSLPKRLHLNTGGFEQLCDSRAAVLFRGH